MIRAMMTSNGQCGRIVLSPNRSMSVQSNILIVCVAAFFCLMIGTVFSLAGAWMVLPFLFLELLLLAAVLYWLLRRLQGAQLLVIGHGKIVVAHWRSRVALNRDRVRLLVEAPERYSDWPKLLLTGEGHTIILGDFLNERESSVLRNLLSDAGFRPVQQAIYQQEF